MKNSKCPKCDSTEVIPGVTIADRTYGGILSLSALIRERPDALMFQQDRTFRIRAWICTECGYTELYADEPEKILDSYKRYRANRKNRNK